MPNIESLFQYARDYADKANPAPEVQAQQRGYLGQAAVGAYRGVVFDTPQLLLNAAGAIPGVSTVTEPVVQALEAAKPYPSGGVVEEGFATAGTSLATLGLAAATGGATVAPFLVGGVFGAAQYTQSRDRLQQLNAALPPDQQMSPTLVHLASLGAGAIEAGGESLTGVLNVARFTSAFPGVSEAIGAAKNLVLQRLVPAGIRVAAAKSGLAGTALKEYVGSLMRELPPEIGQSMGETAVERAALGPERLQTLQQAGVPNLPQTPGEAAAATVGPVAISSAIIPGVQAVAQRLARPAPMQQAGAASATAATTPAAPTGAGPSATPGATPERARNRLPFLRTPTATDVVNPLTGEGAVSTSVPPAVTATAPVINPLTGEQALAPEAAPPVPQGPETPSTVPPVPAAEPLASTTPTTSPAPSTPETVAPAQAPGAELSTPPAPQALPVVEPAPAVPAPAREAGEPVPTALPARENLGHVNRVITPSNQVAQSLGQPDIETRFAVVEAPQLIHSLDARYPPELQPRLERQPGKVDAATEATVGRLVARPDFESLVESRQASQGAPIIDSRGYSISGTARIEALKRLYQAGGEKAQAYRQFLLEHAERLGLSREQITHMQHPVLARVITSPLSQEQLVQFADEANQRETQAPGPISTAVGDSKRLTPEILGLLQTNSEGVADLLSAANAPFRQAMLAQVIPQTEHGTILANGEWTADGAARLRRAIFARAYGNTPALERLISSEVPERRNLGNALLSAAPALARLQATTDAGATHARPLAPDLVQAVNKLVALSQQETTVTHWLNQMALFDDGLTPLAKDLVQILDRTRFKRSAKAVSDLLHTYVEGVYALGDPRQAALFTTQEPPSAPAILAESVARVEAGDAATQATLFAREPGGGGPGEPTPGPVPAATGEPAAAVSPAAVPSPTPEGGPAVSGAAPPEPQLTGLSPADQARAQEGAAGDEQRYQEAVAHVRENPRHASIEGLKRALRLTRNESSQFITRMQQEGVVGPAVAFGPRQVLPPGETPPGHLQVLAANAAVGHGLVTLAEVQRLFPGQQVRETAEGTLEVTMPRQVLPPGETPPGHLQVLAANAAVGHGLVTLAEVQRLFPGQQVRETAEGTLEVTMPRQGYTVEVVNVDHISPTQAEIELSTGQTVLAPDQAVRGRATPMGQGLYRIEVTPQRTATTLYHEGEHAFEDMGLLTERDITTMNRTLTRQGRPATAENRAELLAGRLNTRAQSLPSQSPMSAIVRRVQQFLDRLARLVGIRTTGQIVRSVENGVLFRREGSAQPSTAGETTGRLQVVQAPEATPREEPAGIDTEQKPFAQYAAFAQMLTPAELAAYEARAKQGEATFRKEIIPDVEMAAAGENQQRDWEDNPAAFQRFLKNMHEGKFTANEPQMVALNLVAHDTLEQAKAARDLGILTPERFTEIEDQWLGAQGVLHYATMATSTFGRGLRLSRMLGQSPYLGGAQLYQQAHEALQEKWNAIPEAERPAFQDKLRQAFEAQDYRTLRRLASQIPSSTLRERFFEFYYGSILSGIGTQAANEYSTAGYQLFTNALVRPIAGTIDAITAGVTGRERQIFASEALPALLTQFKGLPASFQHAWWLWRGDPRAETIPAMFRDRTRTGEEIGPNEGAWARATWQHDVPALGITAGQPVQWMRRAAPLITAASRLMGAMDVGLSVQAFDQEVAARAHRAAVQQRIPADQQAAFEADYRQHFLTRESPQTIADVQQAMKQRVFHDEVGVLGRTLMGLRHIPGLGVFAQLLMPFAGTPDRLIARGLELLPGWTSVPWYAQNTSWKWGGWLPMVGKEALTNDAMMMLSKQVVGTLMTAALYGMWQAGRLTGGMPDDPAERDAWARQGKVPYAVKVGDTWVGWRRFEPMSLVLGIMTTVFDTMTRRQERMDRKGEAPVGAVHDALALGAVAAQSAITYIMDASYFAGIANFIEGTTQSQRSGTGDVPRGVLRQVASMVTPWVGFQRSLTNALEASGMVPGTTAGQVSIKAPQGLSEYLAGSWAALALTAVGPKARLDVFGQPQTRRTSTLGELLPFTPPVQTGYAPTSTLEDTFNALHYYPGQPAKTDALGKAMDPDLYRRLQERRGPLMQQRMERLVESPGFQRLPPDEQKKRLQAVASQTTRQVRRELARAGS